MTYNHIRVTPLATLVGGEISGVDLAVPPGEPGLAEIRRALGEYGVVFFRDQQLTPEQHITFARCFGAIDVNRFFAAVPGYPTIAEVRKEPEQQRNIGNGWHTDHSYDEAPALGSMLYAREVPTTGGDTLFASMYAAYEALSDGLKSTLEGLRAVHSSRHVFGPAAAGRRGDLEGRIRNAQLATQDAVHPVVIRHPDTGRKVLYVNPGFTVRFDGWTEEEFAPIARLSLPPRGAARIHLPFPVAGRLAGLLGQPLDLALRRQRLPRRTPPLAPHHDRRPEAELRPSPALGPAGWPPLPHRGAE